MYYIVEKMCIIRIYFGFWILKKIEVLKEVVIGFLNNIEFLIESVCVFMVCEIFVIFISGRLFVVNNGYSLEYDV